jgi:pyruvate/2-oxoglutarate dehydrogenase complex dihydrolipoamide acyltransferase (E2) component
MDKKQESIHIVELPKNRRGMAAFQELKAGRHSMYALLEVDITLAATYIEEYKARTGERLSFTGYLINCLAHAVEQDKTVQSYRKGSKQLVMYDDVDVGFMIEIEKEGKPFLTGHVIKGANRKTFWEINQEIRSVQSYQKQTSEQQASWFRSAMQMPWPLSMLIKALLRTMVKNNPTLVTSMAGTVGISSVGMFGKGHAGWGIAIGSHALDLVVGGIARKPAYVDGQIEPRDVLSLTIIFDHDVIDGAPAARFTRRLVELIESGYGLDEMEPVNAEQLEKNLQPKP